MYRTQIIENKKDFSSFRKISLSFPSVSYLAISMVGGGQSLRLSAVELDQLDVSAAVSNSWGLRRHSLSARDVTV
jgi:hypothetical protein